MPLDGLGVEHQILGTEEPHTYPPYGPPLGNVAQHRTFCSISWVHGYCFLDSVQLLHLQGPCLHYNFSVYCCPSPPLYSSACCLVTSAQNINGEVKPHDPLAPKKYKSSTRPRTRTKKDIEMLLEPWPLKDWYLRKHTASPCIVPATWP